MTASGTAFVTKPPDSWHMIRALGGVGVICSLLIVSTYQVTLPVIERNKAEALAAAVFEVLPGASRQETFRITASGELEHLQGAAARDETLVYTGYDGAGQLVGIAVPASGYGFQDVIRLLYGYAPVSQRVIGMKVLESKETPGLGDKILKDADFLANFRALDVALTADGKKLRHGLTAVKKGKKENPWEVDGLTGATISSKAVAEIMNTSAERLLPILARQITVLRRDDE